MKRDSEVELKPEFEARIKKLLNGQEDYEAFCKVIRKQPLNYIRCNTLKISVKKLVELLEKKGWKIKQPFPEISPATLLIESDLMPGELGKSREHILGYYYAQELSSQLPLMVLKPNKEDVLLDCCASPGSKTTQAAALMENQGLLIANDLDISRIKILSANLERCGVSNEVVAKDDAIQLCQRIKKHNKIIFSKILVDAPCSGEGTLRSSLKAAKAWNFNVIKSFSKRQKRIASAALEILQVGGEMIYSTCTHSPEENEDVVQHLLDKYDIELMEIKSQLPIKSREGVTEWNDKKYSPELKKCARIYPQDNDTEGFFVSKMKKLSDKIKGEKTKLENA